MLQYQHRWVTKKGSIVRSAKPNEFINQGDRRYHRRDLANLTLSIHLHKALFFRSLMQSIARLPERNSGNMFF